MPICTKCEQDKAPEAFNFNKTKNRLEYHCKKCHSNYLKAHYIKRKDYYKDKARRNTEVYKEWFRKLKSKLKCSIVGCDENHPACLDFHHTDPNEKDFEISTAISHGWSKAKILVEIAKCIVLCANCHRKLHASSPVSVVDARLSTKQEVM